VFHLGVHTGVIRIGGDIALAFVHGVAACQDGHLVGLRTWIVSVFEQQLFHGLEVF
jgi:hypothetical protein